MLKIGQYQDLEIIKTVDFGLYLDGGPYGEILMPSRYVPEQYEIGDEINVFIYCDSEDRIIATTEKPVATVGEFAYLKAQTVNKIGAFLEWGLMKDLLIPYREQDKEMEVGQSYLVKIYLDETTDRIVGSSRLDRYLQTENEDLEIEQEVDLIIAKETDLGFKVIVNEKYWALLFKNEVFQDLSIGQKIKGFVKNIREDLLIDVSLRKQGFLQQNPIDTERILELLKAQDGFLALTDKSDPAMIYQQLKMSKKAFKKAIGALYKQRLIRLEKDGTYLAEA